MPPPLLVPRSAAELTAHVSSLEAMCKTLGGRLEELGVRGGC